METYSSTQKGSRCSIRFLGKYSLYIYTIVLLRYSSTSLFASCNLPPTIEMTEKLAFSVLEFIDSERSATESAKKYRQRCSHHIRVLRRKLHISQKPKKSYESQQITVENIKTDIQFFHLLIFLAQRNIACADELKLALAANRVSDAVANARRLRRTKLANACKLSKHAFLVMEESSLFSPESLVECGGYWKHLQGLYFFEICDWKMAISALSAARISFITLMSLVDTKTRSLLKNLLYDELDIALFHCLQRLSLHVDLETLSA